MVRPLVCYDCGKYLHWDSAWAVRLNSKIYYLCPGCYRRFLPRAMRNQMPKWVCPRCKAVIYTAMPQAMVKCPACGYKVREKNPIRHTKEGWFWGSVGPQPTKEKLLRQVRAIYASGYKGRNPEKKLSSYERYIRSLVEERAKEKEKILKAIQRIEKLPVPNPESLYQAFHGVLPLRQRKISYEPPKSPLVKIGRISQLNYTPEFPSKKSGTEYYHRAGDLGYKTIKGNAILATDLKGKNLYIIRETSSKYPIFTDRGIEG